MNNSTRIFDAKVKDSLLNFAITQLTHIDQTIYNPLFTTTYTKDVPFTPGLDFSYDTTAYIQSQFASVGTQQLQGMPWLDNTGESTTIPAVTINGRYLTNPLRLAGRKIAYTTVELDRSQRLGQSVDTTKMIALMNTYQLNMDKQVYLGDTFINTVNVTDSYGLFNAPQVVFGNVVNAASGTWAARQTASPSTFVTSIIADFAEMLQTAWAATGYAVAPDTVLLPPSQYALLVAALVSSAGNQSLLNYLQTNNLSFNFNGKPLSIAARKYLVGAGAAGSDRMVAYSNDFAYLDYPMVPIRRETPYLSEITVVIPHIWAAGNIQIKQPETVLYRDGI